MKKSISALLVLALVMSLFAMPGLTMHAQAAQTKVAVDLEHQITVTVPTELAVSVSATGTVTVATDAYIQNDSTKPVVVEELRVIPLNEWVLKDFSTTVFTARDKGKKEFAMAFDGKGIGTGGVGRPTWYTAIEPGNRYIIDYNAKVPIQSEQVNEAIAKIVFLFGVEDENANKNSLNLVFVDSDNAILGKLEGLYTDTDLRDDVEEYVKQNLIAPQLWDKDPNSVAKDAYYTTAGNYPLCHKADFAFVRQPMEQTVNKGVWVIKDNLNAMGRKQYKYIYGWALCTEDNYERVDTVIGEGGIPDYNNVAFRYSGEETFLVADMEEGIETDVNDFRAGRPQTVYLKAIYRPGSQVVDKYVPDLPENYMTILMVDWDNAMLGAFAADTNSDNLERVNAFVENFIYPTLRGRDPTSLARKDNYFGDDSIATIAEQASLFGADDSASLFGMSAEDRFADEYALTSHLDYCFVKMPLKQEGNTITQEKVATDYPYTNGWALCTMTNYMNTWTTLGVGELENWDGTTVTAQKAHKGVESYPLVVADIANLVEQSGTSGKQNGTGMAVLKAIYQPGPDLKDADYTPIEDKCYVIKTGSKGVGWQATNYNIDPQTGNYTYLVGMHDAAIFAFNYSWARKTYSNGQVYGVKRCRKPHALCQMLAYEAFETSTLQADTNFTYTHALATDMDDGGVDIPVGSTTDRDDSHNADFDWGSYGIYDIPVYYNTVEEALETEDTSKDVLKFRTEMAPPPHQFQPVLVDAYNPLNYVQRGPKIYSDVAGVRQPWAETEGKGPVFWLNGLGYYRITMEPRQTFDELTEHLCMFAGLEQQGLRNTTMYMLVGDQLRLPNPIDDAYWNSHSFTNDNLDPYSQCIHTLTEQIATLHPDKTDDTWWRTVRYTEDADARGKEITNIQTLPIRTARVPRLSYHQLVFFWLEFKPWMLEDGKPEATKPVPMSAGEADAIPLDTCTLTAHAGVCGARIAPQEPLDEQETPTPTPVPSPTPPPSPEGPNPSDTHDERVEIPPDLEEMGYITVNGQAIPLPALEGLPE